MRKEKTEEAGTGSVRFRDQTTPPGRTQSFIGKLFLHGQRGGGKDEATIKNLNYSCVLQRIRSLGTGSRGSSLVK